MGTLEFVVPTEDELLEAFGLESEADGIESTVRRIRLKSARGDELVLSFDVIGASIRIQWLRESVVLVDVFREGAKRLAICNDRNDGPYFVANFEASGWRAEIIMRTQPAIMIEDRLLLV